MATTQHPTRTISAGRSRAPAVTRAAAILEIFAAAEGTAVGPTEVAKALGIAKSSASYICDALVESGLARRDGVGYQLGHRLVGLGSAYLRTVDIVTTFYAVCRELTPDIAETAQLSVLDRGLDVAYLARREGAGPVRIASDVGRRLVATTTATGKAMLSTLPWPEVQARLAAYGSLPRLTPRSIADERALGVELEKVRQEGFAVDDEETLEGMYCIGRVIPSDDSHRALHAISLTMLKSHASPDRLARCKRDLDALASEISARTGLVGGGPPPPSR